MKHMLVNANSDEVRVALVELGNKPEENKLYDLDIEHAGREQKKANIYSGTITHLEKSLDAAFVEYGAERNGFLPFKEIVLTKEQQLAIERGEKLGVSDVVRKGQKVLIQVEKEERGNKGAALTTFISLAGCYLVLMPNNPGAGGISRRIDGDNRQEMKDALSQLSLPEGMGMIIRTAGVGRSVEELQWDLDVQLNLWTAIQEVYKTQSSPLLIHQESDVVMRSIRDYLRRDISEIKIDNPEIFERAKKHISVVRPDFLPFVKLYTDSIPLFTRFNLESQIESAYQRVVSLPSGGAIVIDHTEALISIDINSAKSVRGTNIEATALHTNLEAAEEIARQLRLRDLGGLIVIDFIDMSPPSNQREVERCLFEATKMDRARIQIGRISRFGLLEMSRQRLRPSLSESSLSSCPHCHGSGVVRDTESLTLSILRVLEEQATKDNVKQVVVQVPVEIATYLLNEKRTTVTKIEQSHGIKVVIIPNTHYTAPNFKIDVIFKEDQNESAPSYKLAQPGVIDIPYLAVEKTVAAEKPAIKATESLQSPPHESIARKTTEKKLGFFAKLFAIFVDNNQKESVKSTPKPTTFERGQSRGPRANSRGNGNRGNRRSPQGLSVKDVVKQQVQSERTETKTVKNNTNRPERSQDGAPRRERKPKPVVAAAATVPQAAQEDVLVVKIQAPHVTGKTEFLVTGRQESVKVPQPEFSVAPAPEPSVVTEPARGEDIFAKAQKMLVAQLAPLTEEDKRANVAPPAAAMPVVVNVQREMQQEMPAIEKMVESTSVVVEIGTENTKVTEETVDPAIKKINGKFKNYRGGQRMHGKGRRGGKRLESRPSEEVVVREAVKAQEESHS